MEADQVNPDGRQGHQSSRMFIAGSLVVRRTPSRIAAGSVPRSIAQPDQNAANTTAPANPMHQRNANGISTSRTVSRCPSRSRLTYLTAQPAGYSRSFHSLAGSPGLVVRVSRARRTDGRWWHTAQTSRAPGVEADRRRYRPHRSPAVEAGLRPARPRLSTCQGINHGTPQFYWGKACVREPGQQTDLTPRRGGRNLSPQGSCVSID